MLIVFLKILALLGFTFNLRNFLNSFVKSLSMLWDWVGSRLVGNFFWGILALLSFSLLGYLFSGEGWGLMIIKRKYFQGLFDGIGNVGVILGQRIHLLVLGGVYH